MECLERYKVTVLDEAEERTIATGCFLVFFKKTIISPPHLKLVVMSVNSKAYRLHNGAPLIEVLSMLGQLKAIRVIITCEKNDTDFIQF